MGASSCHQYADGLIAVTRIARVQPRSHRQPRYASAAYGLLVAADDNLGLVALSSRGVLDVCAIRRWVGGELGKSRVLLLFVRSAGDVRGLGLSLSLSLSLLRVRVSVVRLVDASAGLVWSGVRTSGGEEL